MPDQSDKPASERKADPESITGVALMQGIGHQEPKGFWADAWSQVLKQPIAVASIAWIVFVGLLSVFAPLLASGHPITMEARNDTGTWERVWPLFTNLRAGDWLLLIWGVGAIVLFFLPCRLARSTKLAIIVFTGLQLAFSNIITQSIRGVFEERDASQWMRDWEQREITIGSRELKVFPPALTGSIALLIALAALAVPMFNHIAKRLAMVGLTAVLAFGVGWASWANPPELFNYHDLVQADEARDPIYTIVPWSPAQQFGDRKTDRLPPGSTATGALATALTTQFSPTAAIGEEGVQAIINRTAGLPLPPERIEELRDLIAAGDLVTPQSTAAEAEEAIEAVLAPWGRMFVLGTDGKGQDVLSQLVHAARLAISIGLVSTGIAVVIGVTLGALMGYFGGIVDMLLYRVVEVFMAVPVLFILIVAAGLLENPSTYVMMAIIGLFTWHSAARFVRAEFFKLRDQDFVQSAKAVGLPLRSILFKHMLPNGVTPVLVDASFAIALAIHFEATLSFLGLGPTDQASWGRLLADSTGDAGDFKWWLAVFPGGAIFLTALAYNLMGEALRDAIDPKLKKARV